MNWHHWSAVTLLVVTAALAAILGVVMAEQQHVSVWHGMYCTTGFATTAGCDLQMHTAGEYITGEISMLLMVPLWGAVFSFLTAGLTAAHVDKRTGGGDGV